MPNDLFQYTDLLGQVKQRIRLGQMRAVMAANAEMISMYRDIGGLILEKQKREGWGASVIPRLSRDVRNELPEVKGFSERNIKLMVQFCREYPVLYAIGQRPVAQLHDDSLGRSKQSQKSNVEIMQRLVAQLLWGHNVHLRLSHY